MATYKDMKSISFDGGQTVYNVRDDSKASLTDDNNYEGVNTFPEIDVATQNSGENDTVNITATTDGTNTTLNFVSTGEKNLNLNIDGTPLATSDDIGNGTVTFMQGAVNKGSITMNQSSNTTINLDTMTVDSSLDSTSENPVQNKVVYSALENKQNTIEDLNDIRSGAEAGATALQQSDVASTYSSTGTAPINGTGVANALSGALSSYVPTSRTINNKALSNNITLNASDVGALPDDTEIPIITDTYNASSSDGMSGKAVASAISTKADSSDLDNYVPTSRTINSKPLTGNITLTASDVGALSNNITIEDLTTTTQQSAINSGITSSDVTQISNNTTDISTIQGLIPSAATATNQLADKAFVNSSVTTNTANFIGTFNSVAELEAYSGTLTNNDYAFVQTEDSTGNVYYDRYKYNGSAWIFEFEINNTSFTSTQWASINSGATSADIALARSAMQPNTAITGGTYTKITFDSRGLVTGGANLGSSDVTGALGYTPYDASNPDGYIDSSSLSGYVPTSRTINNKTLSADVTLNASDVGALPDTTVIPTITDTYSATSSNGMSGKAVASALSNSGFITGISSGDVTTALGYTPYNGATNPNGYITGIGSADVINALGYTPYDASNPDGFISGINDTDVLNALGYTPYDSSNPDGYIDSSAIGDGTITFTQGGVTKGTITTNQSGNTTIDFDAGSGITIDSTISNTSENPVQNKVIYSALEGKQNVIANLNDIESGASAGATALQPEDVVDTYISSSTAPISGTGVADALSTLDIPELTSTYNATDETEAITGKGVKSALDTLVIPTITSNVTLGSTEALTSGGAYTNLVRRLSSTSSTGSATQGVYVDANGQIQPCTAVTSTYSTTGTAPINGTGVASALNSYVPTSRTINNKPLTGNITLNASDVGALSDSTVIPTITDTYSSTSSDGMSGKAVASALGSYVPTSRTINNKALNANITLNAGDVGALPDDTPIPVVTDTYSASSSDAMSGKAVANAISTKADSSALNSYVPTSRTINGNALDNDVTLNASDVGALSDTTTIGDLITTAQQSALDSGATTTNIGQIATNTTNISSIQSLIPAEATTNNQLADKNFVNSSITTNTANFIGTFNSVAELEAYSGTLTNNDYAFVETDDTAGNHFYDRYKYNGTSWLFEFEINNTTFTAAQLATLNSGCTSSDVALARSALQQSNVVSTYSSTGTAPINGTGVASAISGLVPNTRTINGNALTSNISLTASDVGALPDTTTIPVVEQNYDGTSANAMSGVAIANAGFLTGITSGDVTTALGYTPYNGATNPNNYISSVPVATTNSLGAVQPDGTTVLIDNNGVISASLDTSAFVPTSRTINSKPLTGNITLTASDVGALSDSTIIPVVTDTYSASSSDAMSGIAVASAVGGKQDIITGAATSIVSNDLAGSSVMITDVNGKADVSSISVAELSCLSGVNSNIQTQLNNKISSGGDVGSATATTQAITDNDTNVATTAFARAVSTHQPVIVLSNGTVSLTAGVSVYHHTPSAATTYSFSTSNLTGNFAISVTTLFTFELWITMSNVYALTFSNVTWQDGVAPDMSSTGIYQFAFRTLNGGSSWIGNLQGIW